MNILLQNPYLQSGGAENRINLLIAHLLQRKDINQIHYVFSGTETAHEIKENGRYHLWQIQMGHVKSVTKTIIKHFNINIFQLHNNQILGTDGLEVAQAAGIPTIWLMHDFWPICSQRFLSKPFQAEIKELCYKINPYDCIECVGDYAYKMTQKQQNIVNKCDVGIVPSQRHIDIFEDNDFMVGKFKIFKPWVNLNLFQPTSGIAKKAWQVLFVGNFIPHKGINVLLRAWDHVQRRLPEAGLIAVGDQRCVAEVIALAKRYNLQRVSLIQRIPQQKLRELYCESALTVFPSIWEETVGLIWIESLACGTPVICSQTGAIPELLKFGGEMFPPRDHIQLAEKIIDLLLSPSKRHVHATEGYKYVHTEFTPQKAALEFTKLYYNLDTKRRKNE